MGDAGDVSEDGALIDRAGGGDSAALAELFGRHRDRLERMVRVRLDPRLRGRIDPADVLQEVYIDVAQGLPNYPGAATMPPFVWLRLLTGQRLARAHREHLGAAMRSAGREVAIHGGGDPDADSMADRLVGRLTTASRALDRDERRRLVRDAIAGLDPTDREVIALRSIEGLTNGEAAAVLGLVKAAASNRYVRAMARLQAALQQIPGLLDRPGG